MTHTLQTSLFKTIAEEISDAVVITDRSGLVNWCNAAFEKLCGYSQEEMLGQKPGHLLQGRNTDPLTKKSMHEAVQKGERLQTTILNYRKSGKPYWVEISLHPIHGSGNEVVGFVAIERDHSEKTLERQQLEENLVEIYQVLLDSVQDSGRHLSPNDPFYPRR